MSIKYPSIPAVKNSDVQQQRFNDAVRNTLTMLTQNPITRAMNSSDAGRVLVGAPSIGGGGGSSGGGSEVIDPPTKPTSVVGNASIQTAFLKWDPPTFRGFDYTEVYRFDTDSLALASRIATVTMAMFSEFIGANRNVFYWVRHVNKNGVTSAFHATGGLSVRTALDPDETLRVLSGRIRSDSLTAELIARINLIDTSNGGGLVSAMATITDINTAQHNLITSLQNTASTHASQLSTLTTKMGSAESSIGTLQTASSTQAGQLTTLTSRTTAAESEINSLKTTTAAQASTLTSLATRTSTAESNIGNLQTTTANQATSLSTLTSRTNTAESQISTLQVTTAQTAERVVQLQRIGAPLSAAMLDERDWRIGSSGSQPVVDGIAGFVQNGVSAENRIISGASPYGVPAKIWQAIANGDNGRDGGWDSNTFPVDNTKRYRFSVWVKAIPSCSGRFYLGLRNSIALGGAGTVHSDPFFIFSTIFNDPPYVGRWLLVVGVLHPLGYSGAAHADAGVYDPVTGQKIAACRDYVMAPGETTQLHRVYQFNATAANSEMWFCHPRVEVMDSAAPSVATLLRTDTAAVYDRARVYTDDQMGPLKAERVIKVEANGKVAGIGLTAGGVTGSALYFSANQVAIIPPTGQPNDGVLPFVYDAALNSIFMNSAFIKELTANLIRGGQLNLDDGNIAQLNVTNQFNPPAQFLTINHLHPDLAKKLAWVPDGTVQRGGTITGSIKANVPLNTPQTIGQFIAGGRAQRLTLDIYPPTEHSADVISSAIQIQVLRNGVPITFNGEWGQTYRVDVRSWNVMPGSRLYRIGFLNGNFAVDLPASPAEQLNRYTVQIIGDGAIAQYWLSRITIKVSIAEAIENSGGTTGSVAWGSVLGKPTTLSGYGITDALPLSGGSLTGNVNINSGYLTLSQGWDISWGGRYLAGFPTITGNLQQLYLYPSGQSGGAYTLGSALLSFPTAFDFKLGPYGNMMGFYTQANEAKIIGVGGVCISDNYTNLDQTPRHGLFVKGDVIALGNARFSNKPNTGEPEWSVRRSQLQIYSDNGDECRLAFHRGGFTVTTLVHNGNGLHLTNGDLSANNFRSPLYSFSGYGLQLGVGLSNTDAVSVRSPYGYIDIGAMNASFAHFATDRASFYMNKTLAVDGQVKIYNSPWYFGNGAAKNRQLDVRHVDGLAPDGASDDDLYLNWRSGRNVHIGNNGSARLIARNPLNDVWASAMSCPDSRSGVLRSPAVYNSGVSYEFLDGATAGNSGETYIGSMIFRPYGSAADWSGGAMHKLHFATSGKLYHQTGNAGGWSSYQEIVKYEPSGYLMARNWINLPESVGLYYNNGTHFSSQGNGRMALSGSAADSWLRFGSNTGTNGYVYADYIHQIGFLNNLGGWMFRVNPTESGGRAFDGAGNKYMKWSDFTPSIGPPAGLEGAITASWLAAGVVTANIIATGGLNVVDGGNRVLFHPKANTPILFEKDGVATFSVNIDGTGFFKGSLAKDTVNADAIQNEAKKAINPHYLGNGQRVASEVAEWQPHDAAFVIGTLSGCQARDRIAVGFRFADTYQWNDQQSGSPPIYSNSSYTLYIQRSISGGAWATIATFGGTVFGYRTLAVTAPGEPRTPETRGYYYSFDNTVTDILPAGTSGSVSYRVYIACTSAGTGTNTGLMRRRAYAERSSFVVNTIEEVSGQLIFIDKETGYTSISGQVTVPGKSEVFVNFYRNLSRVYSCNVSKASSENLGWERWEAEYTELSTTGVKIRNAHTAALPISYHVTGVINL